MVKFVAFTEFEDRQEDAKAGEGDGGLTDVGAASKVSCVQVAKEEHLQNDEEWDGIHVQQVEHRRDDHHAKAHEEDADVFDMWYVGVLE